MSMRFILVSTVAACLAACGQKGALYMPTGEAAAGRATLTETIGPATVQAAPSPAQPASAPPTGTASPVRQP
ncbi:MAG: lipoprotein [Burkholderiales bacterium]|nr:lipoprotein [Burkholderiales bacterium]